MLSTRRRSERLHVVVRDNVKCSGNKHTQHAQCRTCKDPNRIREDANPGDGSCCLCVRDAKEGLMVARCLPPAVLTP